MTYNRDVELDKLQDKLKNIDSDFKNRMTNVNKSLTGILNDIKNHYEGKEASAKKNQLIIKACAAAEKNIQSGNYDEGMNGLVKLLDNADYKMETRSELTENYFSRKLKEFSKIYSKDVMKPQAEKRAAENEVKREIARAEIKTGAPGKEKEKSALDQKIQATKAYNSIFSEHRRIQQHINSLKDNLEISKKQLERLAGGIKTDYPIQPDQLKDEMKRWSERYNVIMSEIDRSTAMEKSAKEKLDAAKKEMENAEKIYEISSQKTLREAYTQVNHNPVRLIQNQIQLARLKIQAIKKVNELNQQADTKIELSKKLLNAIEKKLQSNPANEVLDKMSKQLKELHDDLNRIRRDSPKETPTGTSRSPH